MPIVDDPRYTQDAVAGPINTGLMLPREEDDEPAVLDTLAAAARQSTLAGAGYARIANRDPDLPEAPPGWDALDHIAGYEDHAGALADSATPSDLAGRLSRINEQRTDRETLRRAGIGPAAEIALNLLDPTFLVAAAVPELAAAKVTRMANVGRAAAEGAAATGVYEAGMRALQEDRSATESLFNVGAGALLSGVLGAVLHRAPRAETQVAREAIAAESAASTAGAAARMGASTLERESLATGGRQLSKGLSKVPLVGTDLDRVLGAESMVADQVLQELADVPGILGKNLQGEATPTSVEAMVGRHDARLADFSDQMNRLWTDYRKRVGAQAMSQGDFHTAVASAARRGDSIGVTEVDEAATFLRQRVFDPLKDDATKLGLLDDPVKKAEERAEQEAVDQFVDVETSQIYGDYRAKALAEQLSKRQFGRMAKTQLADDVEGAVPEALDASNAIRDLALQNAVRGEQGAADTVLSRAALRRKQQEAIDKAYAAYAKRTRPVSKAKFAKRAEKARAAPDTNADVNRMAKLLTDQERGALKSKVKARSVNKETGKPLGADSYFRRMYDRDAIRANLPQWRATLQQWFTRDGGAEAAEIDAAIEDVTRKILGADVGQSNFATKITVAKAGPLQERTLDIPDSLIEKFLVNDPMKVASAYVRDLAPQVEMARKFGDVDMKQQLSSISDDFALRRKKVEDSARTPENKAKALTKLQDQETQALEALIRIRNRILNRAGRLGPDASAGTRRAVAASRAWRNWVASARLGATAITGGTMDLARIAAQYGFAPTVKKLTQLVTSPAFRALSKTQARRVGSAVEVALSRRVNAAYDGAITEGWSERLANGVYKYTGFNHITDFNRTLSATLLEDSVLKASRKVADGGTLPKFDRARLASLGLGDDELKRIAQQVAQHGGEADGIRVSGSADWEDKALADIYDAAILKESKITVQQPGAADRVWWMDSETGKLIGQLKSFSLSAPTRLLSVPVQALGHGRFGYAARFVGFMMVGGYLTHSLRQLAAGKRPTTDPKAAAAEAFTESGVGGVFPDLLSPVGRRLGFGESVRYGDRNALSAYGGPALGFAGDVYDFAMNRTQGGMSASDLHMLRRMLPYNNVWYLRREINALEGEVAEALDLQGADIASPFERVSRTDALIPAAERGGTGVGLQ